MISLSWVIANRATRTKRPRPEFNPWHLRAIIPSDPQGFIPETEMNIDVELNELTCVKHLSQCLAHGRC